MPQQIVITENEILEAPGPPSIRILDIGPVGPRGPKGNPGDSGGGSEDVKVVPVTPILESASTEPTWFQSAFDGDKRIGGIIGVKIDDTEGGVFTLSANVSRCTAIDGTWSRLWYITGVTTIDGNTFTGITALVDPVNPDNPMIGDFFFSSTLQLLVAEPTSPSSAASKSYVDGVISGMTPGMIGAEVFGTAAELIGNLSFGTAAQADVEDFASAGHNHDGVYESVGTAAGLIQELERPNGPRIYNASSESEMVGLTSARQGDYCFRSDLDMRVFFLASPTSVNLGSWSVIRWSSQAPGTVIGYNVPTTGDAASGQVVLGSDTRLTGARPPTAHASSHGSAGEDSISIAQSQVADLATDLAAKIPKSIVDYKGDFIIGTDADAVGRLAVSANRRRIITPNDTTSTGVEWTHPDFRWTPSSGDIVSLQATHVNATYAATVIGGLTIHPIYLLEGTLDRIGVYLATIGTSTWRVVLYPSSNTTGKPFGQSLLLDAGVLDLSAGAGAFLFKVVNYTVPYDGMYWAGIQAITYTSAPSVHHLQYGSTILPINGIPSQGTNGAGTAGRNYVGFTVSNGVSTSAPSTCPSTSLSWAGQVPRIYVRYA